MEIDDLENKWCNYQEGEPGENDVETGGSKTARDPVHMELFYDNQAYDDTPVDDTNAVNHAGYGCWAGGSSLLWRKLNAHERSWVVRVAIFRRVMFLGSMTTRNDWCEVIKCTLFFVLIFTRHFHLPCLKKEYTRTGQTPNTHVFSYAPGSCEILKEKIILEVNIIKKLSKVHHYLAWSRWCIPCLMFNWSIKIVVPSFCVHVVCAVQWDILALDKL